MTVHDLLRRKGPAVFSIAPGASLADAASRLSQHDVGALLVLEGTLLVGIVSERDIVRALANGGASALARPVTAEMSSPVATCVPADGVRQLMARMTARRIRHLPVVVDGLVVGVVSIGDVVKSRVIEAEFDAAVLQDALTFHWAAALSA